jgi:hypothetical protein
MNLTYDTYGQIDIADPFFQSLKSDYREFEDWFARKAAERAYVSRNQAKAIDGFLYVKLEEGPVAEIIPALPSASRLKIGTFKINPHGTRLGERFMKKVFDHAIDAGVAEIYVTIFPKHAALVDLFVRYGFKAAATKRTANGDEIVYVRSLGAVAGDILTDYPRFGISNRRSALLSIYPDWHTRLFPDSKLKTEAPDIVRDVSHTNSIHKVYLCAMDGVLTLGPGDLVVIYRTKDQRSTAPAHYTSVVTSVCVVEETRRLGSFATADEFLAYARPYSVFTESELTSLWKTRRYPNIIRFTYNAAFPHRVTRAELLETVGLAADAYFGFLPLTTDQLRHILVLGKINENLIIN